MPGEKFVDMPSCFLATDMQDLAETEMKPLELNANAVDVRPMEVEPIGASLATQVTKLEDMGKQAVVTPLGVAMVQRPAMPPLEVATQKLVTPPLLTEKQAAGGVTMEKEQAMEKATQKAEVTPLVAVVEKQAEVAPVGVTTEKKQVEVVPLVTVMEKQTEVAPAGVTTMQKQAEVTPLVPAMEKQEVMPLVAGPEIQAEAMPLSVTTEEMTPARVTVEKQAEVAEKSAVPARAVTPLENEVEIMPVGAAADKKESAMQVEKPAAPAVEPLGETDKEKLKKKETVTARALMSTINTQLHRKDTSQLEAQSGP